MSKNTQSYYLTFGQSSPARNGWVRVMARDYDHAREIVIRAYEQKWSMLYEASEFNTEYFPAGEIDVIQ